MLLRIKGLAMAEKLSKNYFKLYINVISEAFAQVGFYILTPLILSVVKEDGKNKEIILLIYPLYIYSIS
ncbi:hypothetical protein KN1_28350 [Stygiolobus caldivivus]|uniref:Uncharacterized protein n=1 Tax=Stygiolobus caldivivus TaxID=2824673 RepID=A0A8D5U8X3_9CREN|nr:hypothetical protein KN1_28350 [Stygiolobus caldivivus]